MSTDAPTTHPPSAITASEILSEAALEILTEIYLVANTAGYLYRHLRRNDSVGRLREALGPVALVSEALRVDRKESRDACDLAIAYSCLVALTLYERDVVRTATVGVAFRSLTWAENIVSRATESPIITTHTTFQGSRPRLVTLAGEPVEPNNNSILAVKK